jgi:hypothetical protein
MQALVYCLLTCKYTEVGDLTSLPSVLMISHDALQQNLQLPAASSVELTIKWRILR